MGVSSYRLGNDFGLFQVVALLGTPLILSLSSIFSEACLISAEPSFLMIQLIYPKNYLGFYILGATLEKHGVFPC